MRVAFILTLILILLWAVDGALCYLFPPPWTMSAWIGVPATWLVGMGIGWLAEWFHDTVIENMIR